jgi:hypothetical protein
MSLIPQQLVSIIPTFPHSAKEVNSRKNAQSAALESLRTNHPELFSMKISTGDPGVQCLIRRFGIDVTKDGLLEILLRPHAKRICESLAPHGRKEAPTAFMYFIVKDALNNLDIDIDDLAKIGIVFGCNHECTDETYIGGYISYLRAALHSLNSLKTKTQKRINSTPEGKELIRKAEMLKRFEEHKARLASIPAVQSEASKRAAEKMAANREEARRDREYKRILEEERKAEERAKRNAKLAAHGKLPMATADLLGLHSSSAAAKPEEKDLLNINGIRKKQIANDLASIFLGGSRHTRKHKSRKNRKVRKSSKSRKHTRK